MSETQGKGRSSFFIIGTLIFTLGVVWMLTNLTPMHEYEVIRLNSAETTTGVVTHVSSSKYYNSDYNVYSSIEFYFYDKNKKYCVGNCYKIYSSFKRGDTVKVEYLTGNVEINRIVNTKHQLATRPSGFDLFVFISGLVLMIWGWMKKS